MKPECFKLLSLVIYPYAVGQLGKNLRLSETLNGQPRSCSKCVDSTAVPNHILWGCRIVFLGFRVLLFKVITPVNKTATLSSPKLSWRTVYRVMTTSTGIIYHTRLRDCISQQLLLHIWTISSSLTFRGAPIESCWLNDTFIRTPTTTKCTEQLCTKNCLEYLLE